MYILHFCYYREVLNYMRRHVGYTKVSQLINQSVNLAINWPINQWLIFSLTSVWIFSLLFSMHFLWCWQGEFVWQSGASEFDSRVILLEEIRSQTLQGLIKMIRNYLPCTIDKSNLEKRDSKKYFSLNWSGYVNSLTLTSVSIFSILFTIHFPRCWQREFV